MKRLIHQFVKDVRHQRWLLLAWILLLAADLALELAGLRAKPGDPVPFAGLAVLRPVFLLAFACIHTSVIIFADSPRRESEAWLTRPLEGGTIGWSKIQFIAVFHLFVPLAFDAAKLVAAGAPGAIVPAAIEWTLYRGAGLGLFAGIAAVVRRPAEILVAVGGLWVAGVVVLFAVMALAPFEGTSSAPFRAGTNVAAAGAILLVAGFAAVRIAYARRHSPLATVVVATAAVLALLIPAVQPIRDSLVGNSTSVDPGQVEVSIAPDSLHTGEEDGHLFGGPRMRVFASMKVEDRSDRFALIPVQIDAEVEGPEGSAHSSLGVFVSPFLHEAPGSFRAALGGARVVRATPHQTPTLFPIFAGGSDRIRRAFEGPSELDWTMKLAVLEVESAAELPLAPGASWNDDGDGAAIINIRQDGPRTATIHLRERIRSLLFDRDNPTRHTAESSLHYALFNRERREAIVLARGGNLTYEASSLSPIRTRIVQLDADLSVLDPAISADRAAAWLDGANLTILRVRLDGFIEKAGSIGRLDVSSLR